MLFVTFRDKNLYGDQCGARLRRQSNVQQVHICSITTLVANANGTPSKIFEAGQGQENVNYVFFSLSSSTCSKFPAIQSCFEGFLKDIFSLELQVQL